MTRQAAVPGPDGSMAARIKELERQRAAAQAPASAEASARQQARGKLLARERVERLLDAGSFVELDAFAVHRAIDFGLAERRPPGDGVITGHGTIDGRPVCLFAQDFTVFGGTLGEVFAEKVVKVMELALRMGVPLIGLNDSGGARIQEGVEGLAGYADIFFRNVQASGVIPQLSVIAGPCAGGAVYSPAMTDFILMVRGIGQMYITGPEVIQAVTGETVSHEELGGAQRHAVTSGVAHLVAEDEEQVFEQVRSLLGYLPANNLEEPPRRPTSDMPDRRLTELNDLVPAQSNRPYDIHRVIAALVDEGAFFEIQGLHAQNIVCGFARLDGQSVGIIANQPQHLAGTLDINASIKAGRFVRTCDAFNVPLITLVDVPGFLPGTQQEYGGIIRHGAKLLYAYAEATVPKLTVILRKAYGGAYCVMCSKHIGADFNAAWPTAEVAVMGAEAAVKIIHRREIAGAADPAAALASFAEDYSERFLSPYRLAARGYVDAIIEPAETRRWLIRNLAFATSKRQPTPSRKHGNLPL